MNLAQLRAAWYKVALKGRLFLGSNVRIGPSVTIQPGSGRIEIGADVEIQQGVILQAYGGSIVIGNCCSLNPYSILYGHGGLTIGNNVRIAARVTIVPFNHRFSDPDIPIKRQGETRRGIVIGNDVWIGTGAIVLDGIHIADGCVIGAGAVVTKNTERNGVYVGSPARLIRCRSNDQPR